jgi:hypothetical protein
MSNFNFIPKYYNKFKRFELFKNINGEFDNKNIIQEFYKEQKNKIENNLIKYYNEKNLIKENKNVFTNV